MTICELLEVNSQLWLHLSNKYLYKSKVFTPSLSLRIMDVAEQIEMYVAGGVKTAQNQVQWQGNHVYWSTVVTRFIILLHRRKHACI